MSTYKKIDAALIANIGAGKRNLTYLSGGMVGVEATNIAISKGGELFRIIDRRLQALRKAGKIVYGSKTGWTVVGEVTA